VGVVKRRVLRGLWRRLVGVGIIGTGLSGSGLYTVLGRASLTTLLGAAFALPDCALRGTSGGATMTYRSPGRFYVVLSYSGQGSSYVHWTRACQTCT
jgi:hypothetical protein